MITIQKSNGRNPVVELFRFIFCMEILLWHGRKLVSKGTKFILCGKHGYIGVEFFFFVTGWLIAAKAIKDEHMKECGDGDGGGYVRDSINFFISKITAILPAVVFTYICSYIRLAIIENLSIKAFLIKMLKALWEMCFLYISGVVMQSSIVGGIWYVSAMLIAGTIVYILRRKLRDWFSYFIAPLLYILISGWLFRNYSNLNVIIEEYAIVAPGLLRALGEISLGCFLYEISSRLRRMNLTIFSRFLVTFITAMCLLFVLYSTTFGIGSIKRIEYVMAPIIAVMVMLLFSEQGLSFLHCSQTAYRTCIFLGKLSLPIYLNHLWIRAIIVQYNLPYPYAIALLTGCTFFISFVCLWTTSLWQRFWKSYGKNVKRLFVKENE